MLIVPLNERLTDNWTILCYVAIKKNDNNRFDCKLLLISVYAEN